MKCNDYLPLPNPRRSPERMWSKPRLLREAAALSCSELPTRALGEGSRRLEGLLPEGKTTPTLVLSLWFSTSQEEGAGDASVFVCCLWH